MSQCSNINIPSQQEPLSNEIEPTIITDSYCQGRTITEAITVSIADGQQRADALLAQLSQDKELLKALWGGRDEMFLGDVDADDTLKWYAGIEKKKAKNGSIYYGKMTKGNWRQFLIDVIKKRLLPHWKILHPLLCSSKLFDKNAFLIELLGGTTIEEVPVHLLNERVRLIEEYCFQNIQSINFKQFKAVGSLWSKLLPKIDEDTVEVEWLKERAQQIESIDVKAGVNVPEDFLIFQDHSDLPSHLSFLPNAAGKPLLQLFSFDGRSHHGSILAGACFSLPFLVWAYSPSGIESLRFMIDPTQHSKERLVRVSAITTPDDDKPKHLVFGGGNNLKVLRATTSSNNFERAILLCMNNEERRRYQFFHNFYTQRRGSHYANLHTPRMKVYNMIVSAVGKVGFAFHTDDRPMLSSQNTRSGITKKDLRVATAFFQNGPGSSTLQFKANKEYKDSKGSKKGFIDLPVAGAHWQGNHNQVTSEHRPDTAKETCGPKFLRLTMSARESPPELQREGTDFLKACCPSALDNIYGRDPNDYCISVRFVDGYLPTATHHGDSCPTTPPPIFRFPFSPSQPSSSGRKLTYEESRPVSFPGDRKKPVSRVLQEIQDNADFPKRGDGNCRHPEYPRPVETSLGQIPGFFARKLISSKNLSLLWERGARIGIETDNGKVFWHGDTACLSSGKDVQILAGSYVRRSEVAEAYGLVSNDRSIETWSSDPIKFSAIHLSKPMKSDLLEADNATPCGPYWDFCNPNNQKGFFIDLNGGSAKLSGAFGAAGDSEIITVPNTAGVTHFGPDTQKICTSRHNQVLIEACLEDRVVPVFITDRMIPHDKRMKDGKPASGYVGLYRLEFASTAKAMSITELEDLIRAVKEAYRESFVDLSEINLQNISHRCFRCLRVKLTPFKGSLPTKAMDFVVKADDKRKICYMLPPEKDPMTTCIQMEDTDWVKSIDLLGRREGVLPGKEHLEEEIEEQADNAIITHACRRSVGPQEIRGILKSLCLGVACRVTCLNVDNQGYAGPLVDCYEDSRFQVDSFPAHFSHSNSSTAYLPILGRVVQNNPTPCPVRELDPKVSLLLEDYPSATRCTRSLSWITTDGGVPALVAIRHCMLSEVVGNVRTLSLWRENWNSEHKLDKCKYLLPSTDSEFDNYKNLLMECQEAKVVNHFLHGQYDQDRSLGFPKYLCGLLDAIWGPAAAYVLGEMRKPNINFDSVLYGLREQIQVSSGMHLSEHQLASMLANIDTVFIGKPLGTPGRAYFGKGGMIGARLVDWDAMKRFLSYKEDDPKHHSRSNDDSNATIILKWIEYEVRNGGHFRDWFEYDKKEDITRVLYSGRDLSLIDAEHLLCKIYIYMEYCEGGHRAMSKNPSYRRRAFWPIPGIRNFDNLHGYCSKIVQSFATSVDLVGFHVKRNDMKVTGLVGRHLDNIAAKALSSSRKAEIYSRQGDVPGRFPAHRHKVGYLYSSRYLSKFANIRDIEVRLATLAERTDPPALSDCIDMDAEDNGNMIMDWLGLPGVTVHLSSPDNSSGPTFFAWHKDKGTISRDVKFVPLEGYFFLLVEGRMSQLYERLDDDTPAFLHWVSCLEERDRMTCMMFYEKCKKSCTLMHTYKCCRGDVVSFDAFNTHHATIIPGKQGRRILLIAHGLDTITTGLKRKLQTDDGSQKKSRTLFDSLATLT